MQTMSSNFLETNNNEIRSLFTKYRTIILREKNDLGRGGGIGLPSKEFYLLLLLKLS